jgi:hypothetical protein
MPSDVSQLPVAGDSDPTQVQAMLLYDVMHHLYDSGTVPVADGDRTIHTILDNFFGGPPAKKRPAGLEAKPPSIMPQSSKARVHFSPASIKTSPEQQSYNDHRRHQRIAQLKHSPHAHADGKPSPQLPNHEENYEMFGLPPIPASIRQFATLPVHQPLPPLDILKGDLVIFEYMAKRARVVADQLDASIASIRAATSAQQHHSSSRDEKHESPYPPSHPLPMDPPNQTSRRLSHPTHNEYVTPSGERRIIPQADDASVDSDTMMEIANSMIERINGGRKSDPPPLHNMSRPPTAPTPVTLPPMPPVDPARARELERIKQEARRIALSSTTSSSTSNSKGTARKPVKKKPPVTTTPSAPRPVTAPVGPPPPPETDFVLHAGVPRPLENAAAEGSALALAETVKWPDALADNDWVSTQDIGVTMDSVLLSIAQFKVCALTQDDRIGRYMQQEIGYTGLCCKHCFGQPGYGRYFPSTLPSFVSSFPGTAVKHIADDCSSCPKWIKHVVCETERIGQRSQIRQPDHHGSKGLFQKIWEMLRSTKPEDIPTHDDEKKAHALQVPVSDKVPDITWGEMLEGTDLVQIEDQHLISDQLYATFAQYEKCEANDEDCSRPGRFKSPKEGFFGMRCRHCKEQTYSPGSRLFPVNILGIGLTDNCSKMTKHVLSICPSCPANLRTAIGALEAEESTLTRRYGSRKIFFRRIWGRLHGDDPESQGDLSFDPLANPADLDVPEEDEEDDVMPFEQLIEGSQLVTMEEHGMVSDAHFVAVAQLTPCRMEPADKAGWYKDREVGFPGVCCKHCGGKPSSGRYFPRTGDNFLRSSRHSIIRHLTEICPSCPPDVRKSLVRLQQRDVLRSSWKIVDDSVLGAGKSFHEKLWVRLYKILNVPVGYYEALDYSNSSNAQNIARYVNMGPNGKRYLPAAVPGQPVSPPLSGEKKRRKNHEYGRGAIAKKSKPEIPYSSA